METRASCLLQGKNDLKALLALGMKDLWTSFELLVDIHETCQRGDAIQGDFDVMIFNPIASTILKWLKFEFVR
jgi:hypothetical protein